MNTAGRYFVHHPTLTCALGVGLSACADAIGAQHCPLLPIEWPGTGVNTYLGQVPSIPPSKDDVAWGSRNNRLAQLGLSADGFTETVQQAVERFGAQRIAVVLGTSTSSIGETEAAYADLTDEQRFQIPQRRPQVHNPHSTTAYVAHALGVTGPTLTVSAACASGAKTFASARRWLALDWVDAVVVGGVDSLCGSVVCGFNALQLVASNVCRPFDTQRAGISLGEAASFALLTRDSLGRNESDGLCLLGVGESCDAHHMSSAHPEGLGARLAMQRAVGDAGIDFSALDYVNLHGTGTRANDETESRVCHELLCSHTAISATKGYTGHALGAAGMVEAVLSLWALDSGIAPGTINTSTPEPLVAQSLLLANTQLHPKVVMTNSFGFGGNNCSLVFGRGAQA